MEYEACEEFMMPKTRDVLKIEKEAGVIAVAKGIADGQLCSQWS